MKIRVLTLLAIVLIPSTAFSQGCIDYGDYFHWVGGLQLPWYQFEVEASGDYAYVLGSSLTVVDLTNSESLRITGSVLLPSSPENLAVSGNYAYAAGPVFHVIDTSDPQNPWIAGTLDTPGNAGDVVVAGSYGYLAAETAGLLVVDISDPGNPFLAGSLNTPSPVFGVAVSGSYAYVTAGSGGLQVVDISDPQNPWVVGSADALGSTGRVIVSGNYAFVTAGVDGLLVFDISDPGDPGIISVVEAPDEVRHVAVSGGLAFLTYSGDFSSGGCLLVVDITEPEFPEIIRDAQTPLGASRLFVSGNHALFVGPFLGDCLLLVMDISGSADFPAFFQVDTPGSAEGVAVSGDYVYIADGEAGLQVMDVNIMGQQNPVVGSVSTPGEARGVAISGTHAFVRCGGSGLQVVDVTDPTNPMLVGSLEISDWLSDLAVSGSFVYVLGWETGLYICDITSPASPLILGNVDTPGGGDFGGANSLAVSGNHSYVTDGHGLHVIDITNVENPQIVGNVGEGFYGVCVSDSYAFALEPEEPVFQHGAHLHTIDISDPTSPMITGSVSISSPGRVIVSGDYVFVAGGEFGLQLVSIIDPTNPQLVSGGANMSGRAIDVVVSDDATYVAAFGSGLQVMPLQCESPISIEGDNIDSETEGDIPPIGINLSIHPNPFNPQTTVSFFLECEQRTVLSVFDLTGRRVAVLADRLFTEGYHNAVWNGRDRFGRAMSSGHYLVRLETEGQVVAEKVMLVR